MTANVERISHVQRRVKRREIANHYLRKGDLAATARKFGRTLSWVKECCKEHGVPVPKADPEHGPVTVKVIAMLMKGKIDSQIAIAKAVGRSRVFVGETCKLAVRLGIPVAARYRRGKGAK